MPTEKKRQLVQELHEKIARCRVAIATDYRGIGVNALTELRQRLREKGVEYRVVKNNLLAIAADQAERQEFKQLLEGPTGIVFGYGDPVEPAKLLDEYIRVARSPLVVRSAVIEGRLLTGAQVRSLAALPPREELVAQLLGQMQAPITGLVNVLSAPLRGLVTVLQRRTEQQPAGQTP